MAEIVDFKKEKTKQIIKKMKEAAEAGRVEFASDGELSGCDYDLIKR